MLSRFLGQSFLALVVNALHVAAIASSLGNATLPNWHGMGTPPCDALLAAGLRDRLLLPTDADYEPRVETWWAKNARLHPWCIVLPRNSDEVSLTLSTLKAAGQGAGDWHIAVRSGGHSNSGNNIDHGVTIDLSMMNASHYDKGTNTARLEPGGRWEYVFASLQNQGVTVAGGRDGGVGVGGFLLGGGNSFFSGKLGFGCDNVINHELVLANGSIINANATSNSDLWRALKGGSGNFGIVTRFDLEAIPTRNIFYELRYLSGNYSDKVINTVVDFANHDESLGDNALVAFLTHNTSITQSISIGTIYVNTAGDKNAQTSFDNISNLPAIYNKTVNQNMAEAAAGSQVPGGTRNAESTLTFKNDPEILRYCAKLHQEYVKSLGQSIGADNFTTMMFFQPIPSYFGRIGQRKGGNSLGIENMEHNAVLWTAGVTVNSDEASLAIAQSRLLEMGAKVKEFSKSVHGDIDFIYLNYADVSQDPLGSYGASQVQHLRDVATKFDPASFFQKRVPGGFKIDRVV